MNTGNSSGQSSPESAPQKSEAKDLIWTSSTYFAEGLPWSILHQVAAEFFTSIGAAPARVGATSLLHGPTLLKVVWSPFVQLFGTLRSWMVATQAMMGVVVGLLALLAHSLASRGLGEASDTSLVWGLLILIGVLSATHDIACDGYYMEALNAERQARFSGLRVAAFRAAMLVGSSGLVVVAGASNWLWGFGTGAVLLLGLALYHYLFLAPDHLTAPVDEANGPVGEASSSLGNNWGRVKNSYLSFLKQDSAILVVGFLLTYKMADVLLFSMSRLMFKNELGIGLDLRGTIGFFSTISSIVGAVVGGIWIAKRGLGKTLVPITVLMAVTLPLYSLLATQAPNLSIFREGEPATFDTVVWSSDALTLVLATVVIMIEQVCGGFATAAQMVFIMRRCNPQHRTAHFAFATAIYSSAQMAMGFGSGYVYEITGASAYFWIVSALAIPAVVFAWLVPKD